MRKKEIIEKLKDLETFIENVSSLQTQLFKELGYKSVLVMKPGVFKDEFELRKVSDEKISLTHDDRHTLFELIRKIDPKIDMADVKSQSLLNKIESMIKEKVQKQ